MRVLITGGAGYLGSVLTEVLLARGRQVTVLDNLMWGQTSLLGFCHHPNFQFVLGDARDERVLKELLPQHDVIIPLAALVGASLCDRDPWAARTTNLDAILTLNRLRSPSQAVVYPNTNSGYGTQSGDLHCTEETPLEPISLYGRTKVEAEQALLGSENVVTFRLATVFGTSPRMRLDLLVNQFVLAAVKERYLVVFEKDFKRNYVHIRDVADGFDYALENVSRMRGRCYNLGLDDANLSKGELAEKIQTFVKGFFVHYAEIGSDPDQRNYIVSNERLRQAGFAAKRSLDEGIRELLVAYRMLPRESMRNA
jgi:nucleoside-diphosphate-sugar epimerase